MKNESFVMLNQREKRKKLIGMLNFKSNGVLSRRELENISDAIDHSRQYSVRFFFDCERFEALTRGKDVYHVAGVEIPKTVIRKVGGEDINQICILVPPQRTHKAHRM